MSRAVRMQQTGHKAGPVEKDSIDETVIARKTNDLPGPIPSVLLINSDMVLESITERTQIRVPDAIVNYAKDRNVLIVRTIDLLLLMRHLEENPNRGRELVQLVSSKAGWLKISMAK